jgi:hypothetical protein
MKVRIAVIAGLAMLVGATQPSQARANRWRYYSLRRNRPPLAD